MKFIGPCAVLALLCCLGWYAKMANLRQRAIACNSAFPSENVKYSVLNNFVAECELQRSVNQ